MELAQAASLHQMELARNKRSPATCERYARVENRFIAFVRQDTGRTPTLADLNVSMVRRFLVAMEAEKEPRHFGGKPRGHGARTLAHYARILKIWSKMLADEWDEELPRDPLSKLRVTRPPRTIVEVFTRDQVDLLLSLAAATRYPQRNRALLLFLIETGCRLSELCALERVNVELFSARRTGRARIIGKGSHQRYVYFGGECSKALVKYHSSREYGEGRDPHVFRGPPGKALRPGVVQQMVADLGHRAGIQNVRCSPHTLRHTMATWFLKANPGRMEQLRIMLGHADLSMVLVYAKLAEADVEASYVSLMDGWRQAR